jgi:hypothetical protein
MRRRSAVPALALALATACDSTISGPNRVRADVVAPSFQSDEVPSETECVGLLHSGTFQNVIVPPGRTCFLVQSTVTGNVIALEGSRLTTSENEIAGNIEADKAGFAELVSDIVGGDVVIADGRGDAEAPGSFRVDRLTLTHGNVHARGNDGGLTIRDNQLLEGSIDVKDNVASTFLNVSRNQVARNIDVSKNTGPGNKTVRANTAGHSIKCHRNEPPFFAELNVAPKLKGQCDVPPTVE